MGRGRRASVGVAVARRPRRSGSCVPVSLSVAIITLDEELDLPRCLASVAGLADEIVVVDSLSSDRTVEVARQAGARVVEQAFLGHVRQKQLALETCTGDWVLCLDADEWLDDTLRAAVRRVLDEHAGADSGPVGYRLNRRTSYLGAWIDHCGWSPEWRLRLVRRGRARWAGTDPHDRLEADGVPADLPGRLCHRPYVSLSDHLATVNRYTDIMVARRREAGERGSLTKLVLRPPARFLRMYVLRAGFLDGWRGLLVSSIGAFYVFAKYAKLLAVERGGDPTPD
ncbi:MAG: glycosyltransferase family 2 protein [Planctomycetes bacterium]|nr:glycosyltransferase family 2 protein [Planctomycetota bacterium]